MHSEETKAGVEITLFKRSPGSGRRKIAGNREQSRWEPGKDTVHLEESPASICRRSPSFDHSQAPWFLHSHLFSQQSQKTRGQDHTNSPIPHSEAKTRESQGWDGGLTAGRSRRIQAYVV